MITLLEGMGVGSGKSYWVTHKIVETIAVGGTVYHSSDYQPVWEPFYGPMEYDRPETILGALWELFTGKKAKPRPMGMRKLIEDKYGVIPERDQLREVAAEDVWCMHEKTAPGTDDCPVLIVVDEAQGGLNSRDTMDKKKRPLFDWCTQSRHDSNDLIFITQHIANVDAQCRRLASAVCYTRNLGVVGFPGVGKIPLFLWQEFSPDQKQCRSWEFRRRDWRYFGAYVSKACRGKHVRAQEAIQRRQLARKTADNSTEKKPMKLMPILLVGGLILGAIRCYMMFDNFRHPKKQDVPVSHVRPGELQDGPRAVSGGRSRAERPPLWSVVTEEFRGTDGVTFLHTSGGEYRIGQMSPVGLVEMIQGDTARCRDPHGELLFVVAKRDTARKTPAAEPEKPKWGAGEMSAKWEPNKESAFAAAETARIKAELERPVGVK